ncbi:hypothetical protein [Winogradskyella sp.]|uniref:hypothetical protein n=1 Tax=Winogradskyella sp. TaxID=1883156 RepID=UPI002627E74D|nr:hypothetical protein [Winogradskyella sp.]
MEKNKSIKQKIEATINSVDAIDEVKISPFFKEKTLRQMFSEKQEESATVWSWFTPQLQFATLILIVALNVFAVMQLRDDNYDEEISTFAESYGLLIDSEDALIN